MKLNKDRIDDFKTYLTKMMEKHNIPGISVAIAHKEDVLFSEGFGYRDKKESLEIDPDTILGIASISKSFAALAIAQLVEKGKMSYDDSIKKYYPNFKLPDGYDPKDIKIYHMLDHTTGFPPLKSLGYSIRNNTIADQGEDRSKFDEKHKVDTIEQLAEYMSLGQFEMLGKPGEILSYSNDCYGLLGGIVEKVSNKKFQDYIKENVFGPLSMNRSFFDGNKLKEFENVTTLYYEKDDEIKASNNWQEAPPYLACGWVRSCANDLIRYGQMYANGGEVFGRKVISESSIEEMISGGALYSSYSKYGFGLSVTKDYNGLTLVEHGGSLKGVSSHFGFIPEASLAVVVLCNLSGVAVSNIWLAAVNAALSLPLETQRREYKDYKWDKDNIADFEGIYTSGEGAVIEIEINENILLKRDNKNFEVKMVGPFLGIIEVNDRIREVKFISKNDSPWAIYTGGRVILKEKSE